MPNPSITLICPNLLCRSILQVPESVRGRKVRCGKCGRDFIVPAVATSKQAKKPSSPAPAEAQAD